MGSIAGTRSGKVEGLERDGIHGFRGIPFAAPPVGELRWMAPRLEEPWDDVRDATKFSPICAQTPFALEQMMGGEESVKSEDALYLNVWTPGLDDRRRPVLFWIHGGGFMNGSGSTPWYDGTRFARNGDVVVVTINYRLGAFGFLHLADLFGSEFEGSGNAGILDQVAALEWVRDNIAGFGGDPANVTIFGESAGAASVGTLLGLPQARGLFHGAAAQSGAAAFFAPRERAGDVTTKLVAALGVEPGDVDALRAKSTDEIIAAMTTVGLDLMAGSLPFQPVIDGSVISRPPLAEIADGNAAGVRVLIGTNRDEMTLFHLMDPSLDSLTEDELRRRGRIFAGDQADAIIDAYRAHRPDDPIPHLFTVLSTDAMFRIPAIRLAEAQAPHGPAWMYQFTWETPVFDGRLRSTHALEIPFVWDNLDRPGAGIFTGDGPERQRIADAMHNAWINFAQSGDPGHEGLPAWPRYDLERRATMRFDADCELLDDPAGDERRLWEGHTR